MDQPEDRDRRHPSYSAVNRTEVLTLIETKAAPAAGNIGLFVDIGSESFLSNLKVTPN
jgi:hypothetical protein